MSDRLPLSTSDKGALLVCAAMHAQQYLDRIGGCLDLLAWETGANLEPTLDHVSSWTETLFWLKSLVDQEAEELRAAIAGEDPSSKRKAGVEDAA